MAGIVGGMAEQWRQSAQTLYWHRVPREMEVETGKASESKVSRKAFVNPHCSRDLALALVRGWDDICSDPEFADAVTAVGTKHKRGIFINRYLRTGGKEHVAKYHSFTSTKRKLQSTIYYSEAQRNNATMLLLRSKGLNIPKPVAVLSETRYGVVTKAVLFMERYAREFRPYRDIAPLVSEVSALRSSFLDSLGRDLGLMHRYGIYTEDTDKNTAVTVENGRVDFCFFDFDNAFPWRVPSLKKSVAMMQKYLSSFYLLSNEELSGFIDLYLKIRGKASWRNDVLSRLCGMAAIS